MRPGYYEFECGALTLGQMIFDVCGGLLPGRSLKAVIPGGSSMPLWDFVGSTIVTNNYVRLTSDHQSRQGGIWNTQVYTCSCSKLHVLNTYYF